MNLKYNSFTMSVIFRQVHEGQELAVVEAMKMQKTTKTAIMKTIDMNTCPAIQATSLTKAFFSFVSFFVD